jgi:hypothetical protein
VRNVGAPTFKVLLEVCGWREKKGRQNLRAAGTREKSQSQSNTLTLSSAEDASEGLQYVGGPTFQVFLERYWTLAWQEGTG